jgi:hypothetical protein
LKNAICSLRQRRRCSCEFKSRRIGSCIQHSNRWPGLVSEPGIFWFRLFSHSITLPLNHSGSPGVDVMSTVFCVYHHFAA